MNNWAPSAPTTPRNADSRSSRGSSSRMGDCFHSVRVLESTLIDRFVVQFLMSSREIHKRYDGRLAQKVDRVPINCVRLGTTCELKQHDDLLPRPPPSTATTAFPLPTSRRRHQ